VRRAALAAALALLALPVGAAAQDCPRTTLADIEDEVMCPVCGTPLGLASEAPQAQHERAFIERLIAQCRSKDEVKQALVAEFGDRVLALPGDHAGNNDLGDVLVYVVPAVGILLAAGGIAFAVVRWRRRGDGPGGRRGAGLAGADGSRLDDDMERYDL
jgi:cytochrome c-type biogenesis protein CcmH/NrfF